MRSLLEAQLNVLFVRDSEGRLVATRDPSPRPAPRLLLSRSPEGNVWAVRTGLAAGLARRLERLCMAEPSLAEPAPGAGPLCRDEVLELLAPVAAEYRGPCFALPERLPRDERVRVVQREERSDWSTAYPWLAEEFDAVAPVVLAFASDQVASICHSARGMTDVAAEAGVETLSPHRRQGLGTAAVSRWAQAVQEQGRVALYSTAWENKESLRIAEKLSARMYGENWHLS